jgi:chromosome segregation ATPase
VDPEQIDKRLAWLDEQRRFTAEVINRLSERLEAAESEVANQGRQAQEVSGDLARLAGLSTRIQQMDEVLNRHRQEVARLLEVSEERRTEKEKRLEQLRKADQEEQAKAFTRLRSELGVLDELRDWVEARREEEQRLSRSFDAFGKRVEALGKNDEDRGRMLASIEEGRKQDARRVTDLQTETSELRQRLDALHGGVDSLEDRTRRAETRVSDLAVGESERTEAQGLWEEQQALRMAEFERSWKGWERRFEEFEKRAAELDERIASYEETYRHLKQLRADLDQVIERLERRINEITEMQRLSEDRLKQDWSGFQADDQKRWSTYKLTSDEQWREHNRQQEKLAVAVRTLEEQTADLSEVLAGLTAGNQQHLAELMSMIRGWASEAEERTAERGR